MKYCEEVKFPKYSNHKIMRSGNSNKGVQHYCCKNSVCEMNTFMLSYKNKASQIIKVTLNFQAKNLTVRVECHCREAELDEQWSFVGNKSNQRWLMQQIKRKVLLSL